MFLNKHERRRQPAVRRFYSGCTDVRLYPESKRECAWACACAPTRTWPRI